MITAKLVKPLTISLTEEIYQKIKEESDRQMISKGEYVRAILDEGFKNEENDNE